MDTFLANNHPFIHSKWGRIEAEHNNDMSCIIIINTKFCTHLRHVHLGHYSGNLCQNLSEDEFPVEIWQYTGTGFNWVHLIPKTLFWFWE